MIFAGSNQTLVLDTGQDLSSITFPRIRYTKPDKSTGRFTATVQGQTLRYTFATEDIDQDGTWEFQAEVLDGPNLLLGEIVEILVKDPIDV